MSAVAPSIHAHLTALFVGAIATLAVPAGEQHWVNYESPAALEMTSLASSAIRSEGLYRIAADDFELEWYSHLTYLTFHSVEGEPSDIKGVDWYIYEFDEATGQPGALLMGETDAPLRRGPSGLINDTFGVIYSNELLLVGPALSADRYFIAFRTVCGQPAAPLPNAPLHPEWTHGAATALWNEDVRPDGTVVGPWRPMTVFHPAQQEWAFEIVSNPQAGCYANCNRDCCLDFFDFLCFQEKFAAGDPYADCDLSGVIDFFDFLCFQDAFQECP